MTAALHLALGASLLLCGLVAGLVFTFAVVVMPGIRPLKDREFLQAFKQMDRVIQENDPRFVVVWLGSIVALIALCLLGISQLDGSGLSLGVAATVIYLLGVQWPTFRINIPLNNRLQQSDLENMSDDELRATRESFETRWVIWNMIRTIPALLTVLLLIVLATRV